MDCEVVKGIFVGLVVLTLSLVGAAAYGGGIVESKPMIMLIAFEVTASFAFALLLYKEFKRRKEARLLKEKVEEVLREVEDL